MLTKCVFENLAVLKCTIGRFVPWDIVSVLHFVHGTFRTLERFVRVKPSIVFILLTTFHEVMKYEPAILYFGREGGSWHFMDIRGAGSHIS